ncbi:MAG: acyl carrier protein [Alphaproteobacteria bacterium]|nr:MAG: acyl carrier protein [Alphaproteobacteria bacterium]
MATIEEIKMVLRDTLQLGDRASTFDASTPLFGSLPELDSMAVVALITAIEERFDLIVEDDEITAEVFETVGSLSDFVERKLAS